MALSAIRWAVNSVETSSWKRGMSQWDQWPWSPSARRRSLAQRRMWAHCVFVMSSCLVDYPYSITHAGWAVSWEGPSNGPRADPSPLGYLFYSAHYIWVPSA